MVNKPILKREKNIYKQFFDAKCYNECYFQDWREMVSENRTREEEFILGLTKRPSYSS